MLKSFKMICLGGVGLLAMGAYFSAGGDDARPTQEQGRLIAAKEPKDLGNQDQDPPTSGKNPRSKGDDQGRGRKGSGSEGTRPAAPDAGWIGAMLEEVAGKGVVVTNVFPGGPAAFAGVRTGDILVKFGEMTQLSLAAVTNSIEKLTPGQQATLSVSRKGKSVDLKVTAGSLNEFHERYTREMLRRDPRDPHYHHQHGVSEADMSVELVRRLFEQNHRLEVKLQSVLDEVQALRKEVRESRK